MFERLEHGDLHSKQAGPAARKSGFRNQKQKQENRGEVV